MLRNDGCHKSAQKRKHCNHTLGGRGRVTTIGAPLTSSNLHQELQAGGTCCLLMWVRAWCRVLGEVLPSVLAGFGPDIVLYDAGVDTHMHDSLGKLNLTDAGLRRRELQVCTCWFGSLADKGSCFHLDATEVYGRLQQW